MKSKTLQLLLKIRKHEFDIQSWELARKQVQEQEARARAQAVEKKIRGAYEDSTLWKKLPQILHSMEYLSAIEALRVAEWQAVEEARKETQKQLAVTLKAREREEMMDRLHQAALATEESEFQYRERRELEDASQARYHFLSTEVL